jgi:hypothetical protein
MVSDDPESFADLDGHCPPCTEELPEVVDLIVEHPKETAAVASVATEIVGDVVTAAKWSWKAGIVGLVSIALLMEGDNAPPKKQDANKQQASPPPAQEKEATPSPDASGAGARKGGGRNEQKSNPERTKSAEDKLADLKEQRDALKSKPNKTPKDKEDLAKLNGAINRETDRMRKSETHSRKGKGQQQ